MNTRGMDSKDQATNIDQLTRLMNIKNDVMNDIGIDKLIGELSKAIEQSESFEFRSMMAKYIEEHNPNFIVRLKSEVHGTLVNKTHEEFSRNIVSRLQNEILHVTGDMFKSYLVDNVELLDELNALYGTDTTTSVMTSNMFGISIGNYDENNIQFRIIV